MDILSKYEYFTSKMDMVGKKIRLLRELRSYTQEQLSVATGISQNKISRLEKNEENLKAVEAEKLAQVLEVSLTDLLSNENPVISFSNNTIEKGYIHNHYEMQEKIIEKLNAEKNYEIAILKDEIAYLRKQNEQLINKLNK
jgi:transcriptional regulator with XRE-family HTH domain